MLIAVVVALLLALALSLPHWLPPIVVRLRMWIFTRVNGEEGMPIPGPQISAAQLKTVYANPAADGRSRGAALSDLFWYWLAPGPELHQEHLEPGPLYKEVAESTRAILALPRVQVEAIATHCFAVGLDREIGDAVAVFRQRDLWMPIFADFYYRLLFGAMCPAAARALIVGNANDVVTALKCLGLRHMDRRDALTQFVASEIAHGRIPHALPPSLNVHEQALYLQGVFFNTAIVQMSEAMAHLALFIAQHPDVQTRVAAAGDDNRYLDHVVTESLRVHPLFGIAHRITSSAITIGQTQLPAGSVLCFEYPAYQRAGFADAERFDPDRWQTLSTRDANYIPFGVAANRPCPAQAIATITMRVALRELVRRVAIFSTAAHTRAIPNRAPSLLVPRAQSVSPTRLARALSRMRFFDRWAEVGRSFTQLALGTYMVWDARRLRLCQRYFEESPRERALQGSQQCPFHRSERSSTADGPHA